MSAVVIAFKGLYLPRSRQAHARVLRKWIETNTHLYNWIFDETIEPRRWIYFSSVSPSLTDLILREYCKTTVSGHPVVHQLFTIIGCLISSSHGYTTKYSWRAGHIFFELIYFRYSTDGNRVANAKPLKNTGPVTSYPLRIVFRKNTMRLRAVWRFVLVSLFVRFTLSNRTANKSCVSLSEINNCYRFSNTFLPVTIGRIRWNRVQQFGNYNVTTIA